MIEDLLDDLLIEIATQSPARLQRTIKRLVELEGRMQQRAERARETTPATQSSRAPQVSLASSE